MIWSLIKNSWIGRTLAAAAGLALIVLGAFLRGRAIGRKEEVRKNEQRDGVRASGVRNSANDARDRAKSDDRSPDDRLHEHGRLRD